ncbi:MAG: hypothetical protein AB1696_00015 [Planctomycetota bacterium]
MLDLLQAEFDFQGALVMDEDGDGLGEYGLLSELTCHEFRAGVKRRPIQRYAPGVVRLRAGAGRVEECYQLYSRYLVRIWLPGRRGKPFYEIGNTGDDSNKRAIYHDESQEAINLRENNFIVYAWPQHMSPSEGPTFCMTQQGKMYICGSVQFRRTLVGLLADRLPQLASTVLFFAVFVLAVLVSAGRYRLMAIPVSLVLVASLGLLFARQVQRWAEDHSHVYLHYEATRKYFGPDNSPAPDAAYVKGQRPFEGKIADGEIANDGNRWYRVGPGQRLW